MARLEVLPPGLALAHLPDFVIKLNINNGREVDP
jgi:hypothetical protein